MKLSKKLENMFSAAAFAEGGDVETARQIIAENDDEPRQKVGSKDVKLGTCSIKPNPLAPKA